MPGPQITTELIKAIATGSVPDLVTLDNPVVASFSAQGTLTDLTDLVGKSTFIKPAVYFEGPWASGLWKSKIYAVPRDANTLALCYNADMFRAKGLDPGQATQDLVGTDLGSRKAARPCQERLWLWL